MVRGLIILLFFLAIIGGALGYLWHTANTAQTDTETVEKVMPYDQLRP